MEAKPRYKMFEVTGIELEYMIVDSDTLQIKPIADLLMLEKSGEYVADIDNGKIEWSNELVNHQLELRIHKPAKTLKELPAYIHQNICEINNLLDKFHAMLLPTASHPFMDPLTETVLWKHEYSEIYNLYNKIFDCRGHGWANLQSMHINLPFYDDDEFARLHSAIRLLLPIIPAVTASSPILGSQLTGWADSRMEAYLHHQEIFPSFTGRLIPEAVFSQDEYELKILSQIRKDIAPFDNQHIMESCFLNSRGAIARFDRGAIEIRVIDTQECPAADIAVAQLIIEVLKLIAGEKWAKFKYQSLWHENDLYAIFNDVIREAENTIIGDGAYLRMFDVNENNSTAGELWIYLFEKVKKNISGAERDILKCILDNGSLSSRIIKKLDGDLSAVNIGNVYKTLSRCLSENKLFIP